MSKRTLYRAAERALYKYQEHKRTVETYEARCMRRQKPHDEATGVKTSHISDPTAIGAIMMAERPQDVKDAMLWIWAIETAWAELATYYPPRARLMEVYYGLNNVNGRERDRATATRYALENELNIEKTTFYRWKDDVVDAVIHAGIQCGILQPYRKRPPC